MQQICTSFKPSRCALHKIVFKWIRISWFGAITMRPACARCHALRNMLIVRRNRNVIVISSALFYDDASLPLPSQLRVVQSAFMPIGHNYSNRRKETQPKYSYRYFWRTLCSCRRLKMWKKQQTKMVSLLRLSGGGCEYTRTHSWCGDTVLSKQRKYIK